MTIRIIELTLSADKLPLFGFLKHNPTKVLRNGDYYKFCYFEPIGQGLIPYSLKGVTVKLSDSLPEGAGWELVRDMGVAFAGMDLITILEDLEKDQLLKTRACASLDLNAYIFDLVCNGITTLEETSLFVRSMFAYGYSFDQTMQLFSAIVKRKELSRYFLQTATRLYKGVEFG